MVRLVRFTSAGFSTSTSEMRSPLRYSSVISARLRTPAGAHMEHCEMN
jgi:hypothetical protein